MRYFRPFVVYSFALFVFLLGPSLMAQATTAVTGSPVLIDTTTEWGNSFLWAMASSWFMRWWKENPHLGILKSDTILKVQRMVASAVAFVNALGITLVFDKDAGQLVVSGLFMTAVLHAARQFLFQEFVYQSALKRN